MARTKVEVNELTDVEVHAISLVKRGANRAPFKILKSAGGETMIDFNTLGTKLFKKEPSLPTIAAVIVNKTSDQEIAKARITAAGLSVESADDSAEDVIVYNQPDVKVGEDSLVLKFDETMCAVVTGLKKRFEDINFESDDFKEVMAQEGFRPGFGLAVDTLRAVVSNILSKTESKSDAAKKVEKAAKDFTRHVTELVEAVPDQAFKVDMFKAEDKTQVPGDSNNNNVEEEAEAAVKKAEEEAKTAAEAAAELEKKGDDDKKKKKKDEDAAENELAIEVTKALGAITDSLTSLTKAVQSTDAGLKDLGSRLDVVEKTAKAAETAVSKAVGGEADGDGTQPAPNGAAGRGEPPLIDTAYMDVDKL